MDCHSRFGAIAMTFPLFFSCFLFSFTDAFALSEGIGFYMGFVLSWIRIMIDFTSRK
jgi:hypothetical protein